MDKEKLKLDRMRYVKDSMPSTFAILAVVFDILYFVLVYKINHDFFYNSLIGVSVIVNLLFMLFGFWASIEVKSYHGKFGYMMIVLGLAQIVRIFIYPMQAKAAAVMTGGQFTRALVYLCAAAALNVVGGLMSIRNSRTLQNYLNSIEKN